MPGLMLYLLGFAIAIAGAAYAAWLAGVSWPWILAAVAVIFGLVLAGVAKRFTHIHRRA